jgi:hypothetical protein
MHKCVDEQRIAGRFISDEQEKFGRELRAPEQRAQHLFDLGLCKTVESNLSVVGLVGPPDAIARSMSRQNQDRDTRQAASKEREQVFRALVDPVEVLANQNERSVLTGGHDNRSDRFVGLLATVLAIEVTEGVVGARQTEERLEKG